MQGSMKYIQSYGSCLFSVISYAIVLLGSSGNVAVPGFVKWLAVCLSCTCSKHTFSFKETKI